MMSVADREAKRAVWLQHLQNWKGSGRSLAEYAREQELNGDEAYRWMRILRRAGMWPKDPKKAANAGRSIVTVKSRALRFARVRIAAERCSAPVRLQLQLSNGGRAELVLSDEKQLPRVLQPLEQPT
jgi:hypothetical protein